MSIRDIARNTAEIRRKKQMYKATSEIYVPEAMVAHIVKNYDTNAQPMICMEELAELQQAISKQCRKRESNLPEEIAHSLISISVLMTIYGIKPSDVEAEIKRKEEKLGIMDPIEKLIWSEKEDTEIDD